VVAGSPGARLSYVAGLLVSIGVAAGLDFYRLGTAGFFNPYTTAAVYSWLADWRLFLYARALGFELFSTFLPQALAGVVSAIVLYVLVARAFGAAAGLFSVQLPPP
jgi:hypothetical protein